MAALPLTLALGSTFECLPSQGDEPEKTTWGTPKYDGMGSSDAYCVITCGKQASDGGKQAGSSDEQAWRQAGRQQAVSWQRRAAVNGAGNGAGKSGAG